MQKPSTEELTDTIQRVNDSANLINGHCLELRAENRLLRDAVTAERRKTMLELANFFENEYDGPSSQILELIALMDRKDTRQEANEIKDATGGSGIKTEPTVQDCNAPLSEEAKAFVAKCFKCEPPCDSYGICSDCVELVNFQAGYNFGYRAVVKAGEDTNG